MLPEMPCSVVCRLEFGLGGQHFDSHQDLHRKLWQETVWDRRAEHGWTVVVGCPGGDAQDWAYTVAAV